MKTAIIGSRGLYTEDIGRYIPEGTTELISGGAKGMDSAVRAYAAAHSIPLTELLPDYRRYGKGAPIRRNAEIVALADTVVAFWDGSSHGTANVIATCRRLGVPVTVIRLKAQ